MKIFAYPEMYKEIAADNLGVFFDYAVNYCGFDVDNVSDLFVKSDCANQFGKGSPRVLIGMSGVELFREVYHKTFGKLLDTDYDASLMRSPEYWAGWLIALYQRYSCQSFEDIWKYIPMSHIIELYYPLHEASELKAFALFDKILQEHGVAMYNTSNKNGTNQNHLYSNGINSLNPIKER